MNAHAVIAARAAPTRFAVLERLATGGAASLSALARAFPVSRQAIAKHLAVLLDAALVRPVRHGRELTYLTTPQPLRDTGAWLAARAGAWDARLAAIKALAENRPWLSGAWSVTQTAGGVQTSCMPDFSVVATVISTTGALVGALGVVALTHRANVRREEAQFNRQRKEQRAEARRQAYADLLGAANQLKVEIEIAEQRHWKDMNVRLATIQQHAVSAGLHASRVALLSPETAEAALALASAARRLAAAVAKHTDMGYQGEQFLGGQITRPADSTEFDECIKRFSDAAAQDIDE